MISDTCDLADELAIAILLLLPFYYPSSAHHVMVLSLYHFITRLREGDNQGAAYTIAIQTARVPHTDFPTYNTDTRPGAGPTVA